MSEKLETPTLSESTSVKRSRGRPKGSKTKVSQHIMPVNKAIKVHTDAPETPINDITETFTKTAVEVAKDNQDAVKSNQEKLTTLLRATSSKYNTLDEKEYQNRIEHMTLTDLQDECMKVGLKPNVTIETRNISIGTLMDLFHENKRSFVPDQSGINQSNLSEDKRAKLLELMKVAR